MRIDKWLWVARFFKTRALAARACELGRIEWNGNAAKPARDIHAGDRLQIRNEGGTFQVEILQLSRELRLKVAAEHKAMRQFEAIPESKPSKRDRRELNRLRGRV